MKREQLEENRKGQTLQAGTRKNYNIHKPESFYEKLFYYALKKCYIGRLSIEYPDGSIFSCGNDNNEIKARLTIKDMDFFKHVVLFGEIGFGEAYTEGLWDSADVLSVLKWFTRNAENVPTFSSGSAGGYAVNVLGSFNKLKHILRPNTKSISRRNISEHYDLGNDLYKAMLDKTMAYSCGIYSSEKDNLEQAQINKYERLCQKLELKSTDNLLEIGSGWGGLAIYAASKYKCHITTITISQAQYDLAKQKIESAGLQNQIDLRLQDYRDLEGKFDKIVSIEMLEAVGFKYFDTFFSKVHDLLKPQGLVALQYITYPEANYEKYLQQNDWTQIYIFPGSCLISNLELMKSLHRTGDLLMTDLESMGLHYARTLATWRARFNQAIAKGELLGLDDKFIRKWNYYLFFCEAGFSERYISVVQAVFSRGKNLQGGNFYEKKSLWT